MAGPNNRDQKTFRNPQDVRRVFDRLSEAPGVWDKADSWERAAFLSLVSPIAAAYDRDLELKAGTIVADILTAGWADFPANYDGAPDGSGGGTNEPEERFWKSPIGAEDGISGSSTGREDFFKGWAFHPIDITLEFFTTAYVAKTGYVGVIRSQVMDLGPLSMGGAPAGFYRWPMVSAMYTSNLALRQVFCRNGPGQQPVGAPTNLAMTQGWVRDFPLLPNSELFFMEFAGLVDTDRIRFTVSGEWRFAPQFITKGDERDR